MSQPTTAFGYRSLADMRTLVYGKIRRKSTDPLTALSSSFVTEYIATWDAYFADYANWTFRRTSKILSLVAGDSLNGAITTASATFLTTSTTKLTAGGGRVSIQQDEIDYSSASGATATVSVVTGAKSIDVSHATGSRVDFLIPVPSDFGKPGEMLVGDASDPGRVPLTLQDYRERSWPAFPHYFVNDGYLYLPRNLAQTHAQLVYYKKAMKPGESDDLQTPRRWDNFVLWATMAECFESTGDHANADLYYKKAGVITPSNPEPNGILQYAASLDADQTDSLDDFFLPA